MNTTSNKINYGSSTGILRPKLRSAFIVLMILVTFSVSGVSVNIIKNSGTVTKYEAEDAALSGVSISKSGTGFSGTGYMDGGTMDAEGDRITFTVTVATTASYPLVIRFQNSCGACEKAQNVSINGGPNAYTSFIGTSASWQDLNY